MFKHNDGFRGTEQAARYVNKYILPELKNIHNYEMRMLPGQPEQTPNPVVFWLHNSPMQFTDGEKPVFKEYLEKLSYDIKHVISVSNFHKKKCEDFFSIPIHVCNNGVSPLNSNIKKFEKVDKPKLIFSSHPLRGLDVLLSATDLIDLDFELYIFCEYQPDWQVNNYFDKYGDDPRIFFFGQTPNKSVRKLCEDSHIFSYPSTYEETFCVSLVESMSAGCLPVIPDVGALPEISNKVGINFSWNDEFLLPLKEGYGVIGSMNYYFMQPEIYKKNVEIFAENLCAAIEKIKKKEWNPQMSIDRANDFTWEKITQQWQELDKIL